VRRAERPAALKAQFQLPPIRIVQFSIDDLDPVVRQEIVQRDSGRPAAWDGSASDYRQS
jgi:hypothetical protein